MEKNNTMSTAFVMRPFKNSDRPAVEQIIRDTWGYDQFCSDKTAAKLARLFLNACLAEQTFNQVAVQNGVPVGVIMGKNNQKKRQTLMERLRLMRDALSLVIRADGRLAAKIFWGVNGVDKVLLDECGEKYDGELAFFAISKECRGQGLGRRLFEGAVDVMRREKINRFFLFTDTTCNYHFYDHVGMNRCVEKTQTIHVAGEQANTTFFLYDYDVPSFN